MTLSGSMSSFDIAARETFKSNLAAQLDVDAGAISLKASAASIRVVCTIQMSAGATARFALDRLTSLDASQLESALGVPIEQLELQPDSSPAAESLTSSSATDPSASNGALIAGLCAAAGVVILVVGIGLVLRRYGWRFKLRKPLPGPGSQSTLSTATTDVALHVHVGHEIQGTDGIKAPPAAVAQQAKEPTASTTTKTLKDEFDEDKNKQVRACQHGCSIVGGETRGSSGEAHRRSSETRNSALPSRMSASI